MSLICTTEISGGNQFDYLTARLRHASAVASEPAAWLPWTYRATLAAAAGKAAEG
ncbi:MAG: hypothetical protein M9894_20505 [Planctomycetes bacterium]|nr:hypothetical protein [Planctomycetota bacterium]